MLYAVITGVSGAEVPVFLLDTDVPENDPFDRTLTDSLYGGDERYRLCQEVVLGVGACACCGPWAIRRWASPHE